MSITFLKLRFTLFCAVWCNYIWRGGRSRRLLQRTSAAKVCNKSPIWHRPYTSFPVDTHNWSQTHVWYGCIGDSAGGVLMLSRDQEYDVTSGSEVVLDCEFHMDGYRMFDNPTVWEKNQLDERTRVNIMGVVQEPFASTRRFEVVFVEQKPRYCLRLTIEGNLPQVLTLTSTRGSGNKSRGQRSFRGSLVHKIV